MLVDKRIRIIRLRHAMSFMMLILSLCLLRAMRAFCRRTNMPDALFIIGVFFRPTEAFSRPAFPPHRAMRRATPLFAAHVRQRRGSGFYIARCCADAMRC